MEETGKSPKKGKIALKVIIISCIVCLTVAALHIFHVFGNADENWSEDSVKLLFVGNSHVYTGNVPRQLKALAGAEGVDISYRDISTHGASLEGSMEKALDEMRTTDFDYVILQDQGRRPIGDPEGFFADVKALCEAARASGAEPVLYNPGFINTDGLPDPERQRPISEGYIQAANENAAVLVNAADAWIDAYESLPGISLYRQFDIRGPHASDEGAFYTACVFAAACFDVKVERVPEDNIYTGENALPLAQAAWDFTQGNSIL